MKSVGLRHTCLRLATGLLSLPLPSGLLGRGPRRGRALMSLHLVVGKKIRWSPWRYLVPVT